MKSVTCNLCESNTNIPLFQAEDLCFGPDRKFTLVKCSGCNLVFLNPRPPEEEMANYYPPAYFGTEKTLSDPEPLRETAYEKNKMDKILKSCLLPQKGRILDVGCGKGEFLANMREKGWEDYGVEAAGIAAVYAQEKMGVNVLNRKLDEANFADKYFDVVTFWHALEHFHNPSAVLVEVNRILKPGGHLLISLPNFRSLQARIMKSDWYHLDIPRHIFHFTPQTITQLLAKTGFQVLSIDFVSPAHNQDGIALSFLKKLERWKGNGIAPLRNRDKPDQTNNPSIPQTMVSPIKRSRIMKSACHKLFDAFVSTCSYLESSFCYGGTMLVYASKKQAMEDKL